MSSRSLHTLYYSPYMIISVGFVSTSTCNWGSELQQVMVGSVSNGFQPAAPLCQPSSSAVYLYIVVVAGQNSKADFAHQDQVMQPVIVVLGVEARA